MTQPPTQVVKPILHCFPSLHVSQPSSQEHRWLQFPPLDVVGLFVEDGDVVVFADVVTSLVAVDIDVKVVVTDVVVLAVVVVRWVSIVVVIVLDEVVVEVAFALKDLN